MRSRRTRIVATLGPSTDEPGVLAAMVEAGVDVVRLNLSHGPMDDHRARLRAVRTAAGKAGRHVGVLADLPGPKVRTAPFPDDGVFLAEGTQVRLVADAAASDGEVVGIDAAGMLERLEDGDTLVLGDGVVTLRVEQTGAAATATVVTGGRATGRPGLASLPERLEEEVPTAEDLRLLDAAVEAGVDLVAVSFIRRAGEMAAVRAAVGSGGPSLVAKIETADAVDDLDAVVAESDALMVARGDLGLRVPLEDVPWVQKRIIAAGAAAATPVITATQVLESMTYAPAPTRAEVSDAAGAVEDGTDALMLSGETAIGRDPALVVRTMARIVERAEAEIDWAGWGRRLGRLDRGTIDPVTDATSAAAWRASLDVDDGVIVCCTRTGRTARAMARFRPPLPLLAITPSARTASQLGLAAGVRATVADLGRTPDAATASAVDHACAAGLARPGSLVIVLAAAVADGPTDVLRLVRA